VSIPGGTMTPSQFADVCESIKDGVLEVTTATLIPEGAPVEGEKLPTIKNRLVIDSDGRKWAAKLQSDRHKEESPEGEILKVHAFMIGFGGLDTYEDKTVGHVPFRLRFTVDSYYEDEVGTDTDNSELWHAREIAMLAFALYRPGVVKRVVGFHERRGLARIGKTVVRESLGEVYIEIKPAPLRPPAP
jgi:hypothetical protein